MSSTEQPVLRYSDSFYFISNNPKGFQIPGVRRVKTQEGSCFVLPDDYPMAHIALRYFKHFFPESKATKDAVEVANQIKEVPKKIDNLEYTNEYWNLFKGRSPYPFQIEDIEALVHYDKVALLLEQGMGKTYVSLMAMEILKHIVEEPIKILVLAPQIVLHNWYKEASQFTSFNPLIYKGDVHKRIELQSELPNHDFVITNYETLVEQKKINSAVLFEWWKQQSYEKRQRLLPEFAELKNTKKYRTEVARALKDLSPERGMLDIKNQISDFKALKEQEFDCVILDEGSTVKGPKASRSLAVQELTKGIPRRYILSGTLCLGDPRDTYMPFTILESSIFGTNYNSFLANYCKFSPYNKHIITEFKNIDDMKLKINPFMISRKREDELSLPKRIETERYFEVSEEQRSLYNAIIDNDYVEYKGKSIYVGLSIVKLNKLLQVLNGFIYSSPSYEAKMCGECQHVMQCTMLGIYPNSKLCETPDPEFHIQPELLTIPGGTPKLDLLKQDLRELIQTEKVIVWANYQHDIKGIKTTLEQAGIPYITPDVDACDSKFEESEDIRVFLGQLNQGIGITLNSATTTIYYSHNMSLQDRLQSMDRNYRIGQTKPVLIRDYIANGGVDSRIVELLHRKEEIKDIMQKKPDCLLCEHVVKCSDKGIEPYKPGCILVEEINNKVQKKTINIKYI